MAKRTGIIFNFGCVVLGVCAAATTGLAQDYLGANVVLRQVEERSAKPAEKPARLDESAQLRQDMQAFGATATNFSPADAAKLWLEFVDRAVKIQRDRRNRGSSENEIQPNEVLSALPPPEDWNALANAVAARPPAKKGAEMQEIGLQFLVATLTGNSPERKKLIAGLQARANDAGLQAAYSYRSLLGQISEAMLADSDDSDITLKLLDRELAEADGQNNRAIAVPNLVSQVGTDKAGTFLRKALLSPNVTLYFAQPNETSRLAQSLALELLDQLKSPQWGLVNSIDSVKLYEALDKRFGIMTNKVPAIPGLPDLSPQSQDDYQVQQQKHSAQIYYMLGLISQDRPKDAVAVAKKLSGQQDYYFELAFKAMEQAGYTAAMDSFFYELLSEDPTLSFWDQYVGLAAKAGKTDRMLALVQTNLLRQDFSDEKKASFHQILFKAELAADKVDDAAGEIKQLLALDIYPQPGRSDYGNAGQVGLLLARIGILVQRPEWTGEGISATKKWLAAQDTATDQMADPDSVCQSLADMLVQLNRGPEAESVLTDGLARVVRIGKKDNRFGGDTAGQAMLMALATVYHKAGRQADVLALLEQSPDWGVKDLSEISGSYSRLHVGSSPLPMNYLAADALLATGQKEQARKIIYELLNQEPGLDRGFELLLALEGTNALPKLDELFARDQFEERPLIWKGHLLRQEGRLEEAEKVIRQAVSIDPSDGDEGKGDRMRVYSELAEIRDARGDKKEADFYREVVKAIRLSEDADDFYEAGLLKRAIAMYETALNHFADAYCIQSRLAIQMADLGMNDLAAEHYRRAYELMPDSFGRVESHCFGCERAFDGERAQGIAEQVFTKLAAERPDKPQIPYLLGYLRQEEERYAEARTNYLTAVRLDSQYLNAWVKLQEVSENLLVSPKDRDETTFNILRLDPLRRHTSSDFKRVNDLRVLWNAVAAANRQCPVPVKDLFALPASKIAVEKKQASESPDDQAQRFQMEMMEREQLEQQNQSPAGAVAENVFVALSSQMILGQEFEMDNE